MPTQCHYKVQTTTGELNLRDRPILAMTLDGSYLGQVRTQRKLADLEREHGSVVLMDIGLTEYGYEDTLRNDRDGLYRRLALTDSKLTLSRHANATSLAQAAHRAAITSMRQQGRVPTAMRDAVMDLPSMTPPQIAAIIPGGVPGDYSPFPDPARVTIAGPPQDPGASWQSSWQRLMERASGSADPAALSVPGEVIHARAYNLALEAMAGSLSLQPGETPGEALVRLSGEITLNRMRVGIHKARHNVNAALDAAILEERCDELRETRDAWMFQYQRACRELLREIRPFGMSDADEKFIADRGLFGFTAEARQNRRMLEAIEAAVQYVPSDWLAAIPKTELDTLQDALGGQVEPGMAAAYSPYQPISCDPSRLLLNENLDMDTAIPAAVHELTHAAQAAVPQLRAAENTWLGRQPMVNVDPTVEQRYTEGQIPRSQWEVRHIIPGDPYANVSKSSDRLIEGAARSEQYGSAVIVAELTALPVDFAEFLPQAMSWLAFEKSQPSAWEEWRSRMWLANPAAMSFALGAISGA